MYTPFNLSPFVFVGPKGEPGEVRRPNPCHPPQGLPGARGLSGPYGDDGKNGDNGSEGPKGTTHFNSRSYICNQDSFEHEISPILGSVVANLGKSFIYEEFRCKSL